MKILGLDEHRTLRGSGVLKFFELERVPNSDWVEIFESLFTQENEKTWVEGYCLVTNCSTSEVPARLKLIEEKCVEANELLKKRLPSL